MKKLQSPGRPHILWLGPEREEVLHAITTIFKKRFGEDAMKGKGAIEGVLLGYYGFLETQKKKESDDQTISLPKIFVHINKIKQLSQSLAKELKWARKNQTVKEALILCKGQSKELLISEFLKDLSHNLTHRLPPSVLDIENSLPSKEDNKYVWPDNPKSDGVLVQELVYAYKEITGQVPWVKHDHDRNRRSNKDEDMYSKEDSYSGDFKELVTEVFEVIGKTPPHPRHMQKIIKRIASKIS